MSQVKRVIIFLLLCPTNIFPFFSCLFPPKKTKQTKPHSSDALKLYKKLFGTEYKIKPTTIQPCTYQTIAEAIATIKDIYQKHWELNKLKNIVSLTRDENTEETIVKNDFLEPVVQKHTLLRGDHVYIHGDLHGDVLSLLSLMALLKKEKKMNAQLKLKSGQKIILLGDYTDRGHYPIQTIRILAKLVEANPNNVFLLRGNHETRDCGFSGYLCNAFAQQKKDAKIDALLAHAFWLQATSFLPHILFLELPESVFETSAPVIACMHAAPPSFTLAQKASDEDFAELVRHCAEIQNFLLDKTKTLAKTSLSLVECCNRSKLTPNLYFPPYLWNYIVSAKAKNQDATLQNAHLTNRCWYDPKNYRIKPALGEVDISLWMKQCSTEYHQICHIAKGHQQHERCRFDQSLPGSTYGISTQFNKKVSVHNISPRCAFSTVKDFWENRADTWSHWYIPKENEEKTMGKVYDTQLYFDFFTGKPTTVETILAKKPIEDLVEIKTSAKVVMAKKLP